MTWLNLVALPFLARLLLVLLFPFSSLDKVVNHRQALAQASSSFLPGGNVLLALGIVTEIGTSISVLFGWHDRLGAFVLAGYCVVTAVLFHRFWASGDFWAPGDSKGRAHFWDFLKNFGLVGGLILLIIGGSWVPASTLLAHPLSSAPTSASMTAGVAP